MAELANASEVSSATIKRIEADDGVPSCTRANLQALRRALEAAGIEFTGAVDDGPGIRIRGAADGSKLPPPQRQPR
ncbi:MAG: hypothetical protein ABIO85_10425 [Sphingomicrobium sp.]